MAMVLGYVSNVGCVNCTNCVLCTVHFDTHIYIYNIMDVYIVHPHNACQALDNEHLW